MNFFGIFGIYMSVIRLTVKRLTYCMSSYTHCTANKFAPLFLLYTPYFGHFPQYVKSCINIYDILMSSLRLKSQDFTPAYVHEHNTFLNHLHLLTQHFFLLEFQRLFLKIKTGPCTDSFIIAQTCFCLIVIYYEVIT